MNLLLGIFDDLHKVPVNLEPLHRLLLPRVLLNGEASFGEAVLEPELRAGGQRSFALVTIRLVLIHNFFMEEKEEAEGARMGVQRERKPRVTREDGHMISKGQLFKYI